MRDLLRSGLSSLGLTPPEDAVDALLAYSQSLIEQNKVMNLTAITEPAQIATLHFLDSAALLGALPLSGKTLIDVGCGAGFPGLPLRLLEPSLRLTLLDSLGKRVTWLEGLCDTLGVPEVACLHARAEEQSLLPGYRDAFDIATARAVAPLSQLCELCLPFVQVGGHFLAMKSIESNEECDKAKGCIARLGGKLLEPYDYQIPHTDIIHRVIRIEKTAPTPKGYPRRWAKIQKAPLV